jgi:phosphatidate phosphatase PAH1
MPDGPVLLSPDLMISSFNREVLFKKADEFKGALLKDL